jgi:hypothetical protein
LPDPENGQAQPRANILEAQTIEIASELAADLKGLSDEQDRKAAAHIRYTTHSRQRARQDKGCR